MSRSQTRKRFVPLLVASLLALALFAVTRARRGASPSAEQSRSPAVIFVVMDTLRADRTSLCGYERPTTPTLEKLVELGATYVCDSHAPSTWTLPSHASFFTGLDPSEHQTGAGGGSVRMSWGAVTPLADRWPTLAEEMSGRGYQTLLLSGNPVVSERLGLSRGFEYADSATSFPEMQDEALAARLKKMLDGSELDPDRPLFAFINISDTHSPWKGIPEGVGFLPPREPLRAEPGRTRYEAGEMSDEEATQWLSRLADVYDYAIFRSDHSLYLVLELLQARGWLEHGYRLVITSDHGEYLGEHQMVEHGRPYFYEPVTRVPFVYLSTGGRIDLPKGLPSIASYALARDGALPRPLPPSKSATFRRVDPPPNPAPPCWYSTTALWKGASKWVASRGEVQRFDLDSDPAETRSVDASHDPEAARLLEHCRAMDHAYLSRPAVNAKLGAEIEAQLKALGYLRDP